jgi:hypothetical protein
VKRKRKRKRKNIHTELNISVIHSTPIPFLIRHDTEVQQAICKSGINKAPTKINPKHQQKEIRHLNDNPQ